MRLYMGRLGGLVITVTLIAVLALGAFGLFTPSITTSQTGAVASPGASPMASPLATPVVQPHATPLPTIQEYPPLADVRDIQTRPWSLANTKFSIKGVVEYIFVSEEGQGIELGDEEEYRDTFRTRLGISYALPNGDTDVIDIGYHDDPVGVYEDDGVIVGGEIVGTTTGETEAGSPHVWPFMIADYIRQPDPAAPGATPPTLASERQAGAATPPIADGDESGPLVISGTGNIVTEDFPLEAGRYEVTVDLASGCCISLYLYGPSGSEDLLLSETFPGEGGTAADIYQVPESGMYFLDSQNTDADWTVTFKKR